MTQLVVSCSPRSGSTALVTALNQAPGVCLLNEAGLYSSYWSVAARLTQAPNLLAHGQSPATLALLHGTNAEILARLSAQYRVVGDKFPLEYLDVTNLRVSWSDVAYVHLLRDGRDVVASALRNVGEFWCRDTVAAAEPLWLDCIAAWERAAGWLVARGIPTVSFTFPNIDFDKLGAVLGISVPADARAAYTAVNHGAWQREHPDLMSQLSPGFLATLARYGFT